MNLGRLKNQRVIIFFVVFLVAGVFVFNYFKKNNQNQPKDIIINRNLTAEERKIYEDRLGFDLKQIEGFSEGKNQDILYRYKIYMDMGFQYYGLGMMTKAENAYREAIKQDQSQFTAYIALYNLYLELANNEKALDSVNNALKIASEKPDSWRKLIELKRDRFNASKEELDTLFQEAIKATKEHADIIKLYAQFLESAGEFKKAWELWNVLSNFEPNNLLYKAEMDRLNKKLSN